MSWTLLMLASAALACGPSAPDPGAAGQLSWGPGSSQLPSPPGADSEVVGVWRETDCLARGCGQASIIHLRSDGRYYDLSAYLENIDAGVRIADRQRGPLCLPQPSGRYRYQADHLILEGPEGQRAVFEFKLLPNKQEVQFKAPGGDRIIFERYDLEVKVCTLTCGPFEDQQCPPGFTPDR